MPDASTQTDFKSDFTKTSTKHRRPIREEGVDGRPTTKQKYEQAVARLVAAGLDIKKPNQVFEWFETANKDNQPLGGSAKKTYLSALKWHFQHVLDEPYPSAYQKEMDKLFNRMSEKEEDQELTEKQTQNYVSFDRLLDVQKELAAIPDKSDAQWRKYLVASLYTLQPPVRADYGEMKVFGARRDAREGNEYVYRGKPMFIFREYKTKVSYGNVEVPVSPALKSVLDEWFVHNGGPPKYILGEKISPNNLLVEIAKTFAPTGKHVGINLLRHAYIQKHLPPIATNKKKRAELAASMLHSEDRQMLYYSQNV
jgi:hypothetical protein